MCCYLPVNWLPLHLKTINSNFFSIQTMFDKSTLCSAFKVKLIVYKFVIVIKQHLFKNYFVVIERNLLHKKYIF